MKHTTHHSAKATSPHAGGAKIAFISNFTGSTAVGKLIQKALAGTRKKLTLELGGKAANIVFANAPLDQAVEGIVGGIFFCGSPRSFSTIHEGG